MILPITLASTHATIINKTIVYSDTVLSLKDMGENIKVTSISKVGEYSLENCLKTIFDSNPDVIFNTIQYSKENKTVYFYTNKEISKKKYEESTSEQKDQIINKILPLQFSSYFYSLYSYFNFSFLYVFIIYSHAQIKRKILYPSKIGIFWFCFNNKFRNIS